MIRIAFFAAALCAAATTKAATVTLDAVKAAHALSCGVITEVNDETKDDTHGDLSGLGRAFCRAVGAAVLGGGARIDLHGYPTAELAYKALQHGDIALMVGDTPQPGLAKRYAIAYTMPLYFDGQALLVHRNSGIASLKDLAGKPVCFIGNTDANWRLLDAENKANIKVGLFPFEEIGEMEAALVDNRCAAQTGDASKLAVDRTLFHGMVKDFEILPDRLSLDPFAPAIRDDDPNWAAVVNGVYFALVQAEMLGVTRANATARRSDPDAIVQMLLGSRRGTAWALSLPDDWGYQAILAAGNYGEMLDRATGEHSALHLPRGLNALAGQGGVVWAPPIR